LNVRPGGTADRFEISLLYPQTLIPHLAVSQLLNVVASYITACQNRAGIDSSNIPEPSILNFPSLTKPLARSTNLNEGPFLLHAAFEDWAARKPHAPALDFISAFNQLDTVAQHYTLSYSALNTAATNLAIHLQSLIPHKKGPQIIPVYMSTSPELYISYLAILKAGFAFSPIPLDAPADRTREILCELQSSVVLAIEDKLPSGSWCPEGLCTDFVNVTQVSRWKELSDQNEEPLVEEARLSTFHSPGIKDSELAYLMFTSGSTGKPKGVQISHLAAACSIESHLSQIPLPRENLRWFQFASPTFDPSLMEIFVTLSSGGTLCSASRDLMLTDLEGIINESQANVMMATPSLAALLRPFKLKTLKYLWTMGEKLNRTVINNFGSDGAAGETSTSNFTLVNAYGPTEGAINCTYLAHIKHNVRGSIIGEPLSTCSMFILDPNSHVPKPLFAGCAGELAIGGPQVSKGYMNRPTETAKAFVDSAEFGRLYRTGDMARIVWDESGRQLIEFLGRISLDQVKLSGRRVELGEIESVLATVSGVSEVVCVVSQREAGRTGSEQVVACLALAERCENDKQAIVGTCSSTSSRYLSSYMCPSAYLFLSHLPRLSSGKINRKAINAILQKEGRDLELYYPEMDLPASNQSEWNIADDSVRALVISALADVVEEDTARIMPETNLYALGLDSLRAMRLLQKLRDHSIHGLDVGDILRAQNLKTLVSRCAEAARSRKSVSNTDSLVHLHHNLESFSDRNLFTCADRLGIREEQIHKVLPTTATQSGMLASFLRSSSETENSAPAYIYHSVIPVSTGMDLERLKNSWNIVIQSYDAFRTVFCWLDDDMAPFAQCILTSDIFTEPRWNTYVVVQGDKSEENTIQLALDNAEQKMNIEKNPWQLSSVTSDHKSSLILSMFHGIFDGGSLQLLLEDVFAIYEDRPLSSRTSLEHIVTHHFQAEHSSTTKFWETHLEGYSPVEFPSLTANRPSSSPKTDAIEIPSAIGYNDLKRASRLMGVTPLSVLQAAWGSILLAYSGTRDQDVVMGSVVSGRLDVESEICIGPTFTTVPIRIPLTKIPKTGEISDSLSVARYLTLLNAETLSYLQPQLGSVVTAEGRLPYDTLLAFQDFNGGSNSSQDFWPYIDHPPMTNDFAVMVEVWPSHDSSLILRATFKGTVMDRSTAEIMLSQMSNIIASIVNRPQENYLHTTCIDDAALKSALVPAESYHSEVPDGVYIHSQFEAHARSNPDDIALLYRTDVLDETSPTNISWTYHELDSRSQSLANYLISEHGPLAGSIIPMCIEKSPALYVALLGILKAGGAWCPIDVFSPPQRRRDLIARTGAKVLLTSSIDSVQHDTSIPDDVQLIDVFRFTTKSHFAHIEGNGIVDAPFAKSTDLAYLIWTSGTTGAPKGVPITHSAGVTSIKSLLKEIPKSINGSVRCLQFSQYTFDVSIQDIFYTWSCGGILISAPRDVMLGSFAQLANVTNATHAHLTPAFAAGIRRSACKTLEVVTMIGEKLSQPVADDWGRDMRAFNTYGPAEVTIVSTVREFGNQHKTVKSANIGWPLGSVSAFVVSNDKLLMKNAVGELALGGPQLSPGYLNQEEVTNAKYRWNDEASQILYHTGDLVRMLSDGSMEFIDRFDDLVKLGGIRVELSEISYTLGNSHRLVESVETAVMNRPDRPVKVVVSFLSAPGAASNTEQNQNILLNETAIEVARSAKERASANLPAHMIPSIYLVVPSIPRTQSAKTDRRALQNIYAGFDINHWEESLKQIDDEAPQMDILISNSAATRMVISIISSLTDVSESSVTGPSRLGSLGIDSIRAIRLASRLNEAGHQLSVVSVLHCQTVHDLLELVYYSSKKLESNGLYDLETFNHQWHSVTAAAVSDDFFVAPATPIQEALLSETMGTSSMYWSNHFFELEPSVDIARLKQAWHNVCLKNAALRTGFVPLAEIQEQVPGQSENFSMLQIIYNDAQLDWESVRWTGNDYRALLQERLNAIMTTHQDSYFRRAPWAVTVFENNADRVMVLTIHHSIHDGASLEFIRDDVSHAYSSNAPSRPQLRDALSVILSTEDKRNETQSFWQAELNEYANLEFPLWPDLTGKRVRSGTTEPQRKFMSESICLAESTATLRSKAADLGVSSIASIIRVAWGIVSLSYFGTPAAVFAETLSDRVLDADIDKTIGPFISVIPVPFHPKGTVREVFVEQNRLSLNSWKYRHVHAREVRRILRRPRSEPLYPGIFTFHSTSEKPSNPNPHIWTEKEDELGLNVEHPLALNAYEESDGSLILEASSLTTVMSPEHLKLFVGQIECLIGVMLEHPDTLVTELSRFMSSGLLSVSKPQVSRAVKETVILSPTHWFETHAAQHPEWTAVEVASSITESHIQKECITYGELNSKANKVAAYLDSQGFRNRIIAICAGRNIPSYSVTLGIFKSGNAYLPIDEGLPDDRKAFLIEDGNCPLVFTEFAFAETFANVPDSCQVVCFDQLAFQNTLSSMPSDQKAYPVNPDDNCYILYTSGSTGKPKGVMVTQANFASFMESFSEFVCGAAPDTLKLGGKGRWLAQASRAFDPHLAEMFLPWRYGMATCTGQRTLLMDDLRSTLVQWDITHASFVPSLLDQTNILPYHCPKLKYLSVGGEKISQRVLDTWGSAPGVALINAYGPTEVTIGCTFANVNENTTLRSIGSPLSSCVCHVLLPGSFDYALRGQVGELCFTGDIVAKGYLNRPDAKGFVTDPHGTKMYRTGDIGRMMPDDSIEYLGRGDDQTKVRGQRLELGEVSEVLRCCSQVPVDVVSMIAKHPALARNQLISFVARAESRKMDEGIDLSIVSSDIATMARDLQDACKSKLPSYMVPEIVLPVTHIPLAAMSGKANTKQLQALFCDIPLPQILAGNHYSGNKPLETSSRALTVAEEAVVTEICNTIPIDRSSLKHQTNIFEIGIDSLSAINLSVRLRNIGYNASVAVVMSNPAIEQLARLPKRAEQSLTYISEHELKESLSRLNSEFLSRPPKGVDTTQVTIRPCLPLQEGLVARSINDDSTQLYINHILLKLDGSVDSTTLKSAWQATADQSDILRTAFSALESEIVQMVFAVEYHRVHWTEQEFTNFEQGMSEIESQRVTISSEIVQNITTAPPVRFRLAKSAQTGNPWILMISMHHSLYDGESFVMLLNDVATRYANGIPPERGSPSTFVEHVYSQNFERSKTHWTRVLSGCQSTLFRNDAFVTEKSTFLNHTLSITLSDIESCSAGLRATVPSFMQAIFALLLADTVNTSDVTYGLVLSGRAASVPGAESVLLPCITTIPSRLNTQDIGTVEETIEYVQRASAKSLEYQHTSLRHIQRWVKSETPLFDCLFSFIKTAEPSSHGLWEELNSEMPADYPFAMEVEADSASNKIHIHIGFTPSFGKPSRAEDMVGKMDFVLSKLVARESISLKDFNLSSPTGSRPVQKNWDNNNWSPIEVKIREIVAQVSGLDEKDISKGASFLSLGIDSVTAIQFSRKLRATDISVSSADIMRFSCVGALALHVHQKASKSAVDSPEIVNADVQELKKHASQVPLLSSTDSVETTFKCTPLQSSMITQTLGSDGSVYIHPHVVKLSDHVNTDKLKTALSQIIAANSILRTSFLHVLEPENSWVGAVHTDFPIHWHEITLPVDSDVSTEIMKVLQLNEESAFCVPPLRPVLIHQGNERIFAIIMHHALYDGVSLPFIFDDLILAYQGSSLPGRHQFADAAHRLLESQEDSCDFWVQKLVGYDVVELPPLQKAQFSETLFLSEFVLQLDTPTILEACKAMEVTVQTIALLAYAKVLAKLFGRNDVVFGHVLAGRSLSGVESEHIIGPLFNTVAQRVTLGPKLMSNRETLQYLQQSAADAQDHQHASLRTVQNSLRRIDGFGAASLFDTLFVFQKSAQASGVLLEEDKIWAPYVEEDSNASQVEHKLNIEIDHGDNAVVARASCKGQFLTHEILDSLLKGFNQAFCDIINHPTRCVLDTPEYFDRIPTLVVSSSSKERVRVDSEAPIHEPTVQRILSEIVGLPVETIQPDTSIFSIGLDSLSAIRIASQCREQGLTAGVADILQGNTLRGISLRIRINSQKYEALQKPLVNNYSGVEESVLVHLGIMSDRVENIIPCLSGQMYHLASWLQSGRTLFEPAWSYSCSQRIDEDRMKDAWSELRQRHPILRTCYAAVSSSEALQIVLKTADRDDETFKVVQHSTNLVEAAQTQAKEEALHPSSMATPPVRLRLLKANDRDGVIFIIHHASYDAWSMPILVDELAAKYQGKIVESNPDFSSFVQFTVNSLKDVDDTDYWDSVVGSSTSTVIKPPSTPTTDPDTENQQLFVGGWEKVRNLDHLERVCRSSGISLQSLVLLAVSRVLGRLTQTPSPTFGLYQTGRSAAFAGIERLTGPCLNVTPFTARDILGDDNLASTLEKARSIQADLAHRVSYEQSSLREILNLWSSRNGTGSSLFNVWVNLLWTQQHSSSETGSNGDNKNLFEPLAIGVPTDFMPQSRFARPDASETSVAGLDTSYLPKENIFIDIGPDARTNTIGFGVRVDGGLMEETEVKRLITDVGEEIEKLVTALG
jgi:amino acid adenylation domain-containing protein